MKIIVGAIVVFGCVFGGFVLHHGNMMTLYVPTEYLIIVGALVGAMIIGNPARVLKRLVGEILGLLKGGGGTSKQDYIKTFQMIYEMMQLSRKEGVLALEEHVNEPAKSSIIKRYPHFSKDHHARDFVCDTLKLFVAGILDAHNMDELMERDVEALHHEELEPAQAMAKAADSLPALGIVAAVLGIILTMSAIDQGAATVGLKVAGALVGTFLGVFLAYGLVGPIAAALEARAAARARYFQCLRHVLTASIQGVNPQMAVEIGRRAIYSCERPRFEELEAALKKVKG